MPKARKRKPKLQVQREDVTPERSQHNAFQSAGMARRVVPAIDLLLASEQITEAEHRALAHYRDQASLAERSPVRSCCDVSPRGGHGPGVAIVSARIETARMEREMGELAELARRVAVEDWSLTAWCIHRFGGRDRGRAIVPRGENNGLKKIAMARMELRFAAWRIGGAV